VPGSKVTAVLKLLQNIAIFSTDLTLEGIIPKKPLYTVPILASIDFRGK